MSKIVNKAVQMKKHVIGFLTTAASLYTIASTTESLCKGVDKYVDRNIDIFTDSPLLGSKEGTVRLRSKSERRMVHAYNELIVRLLESHFGKPYKDFLDKKDWEKEELTYLFRLGQSLENWWVEGLAGQFLDGEEILDPRTVKILKGLSTKERLLIADVQALVNL